MIKMTLDKQDVSVKPHASSLRHLRSQGQGHKLNNHYVTLNNVSKEICKTNMKAEATMCVSQVAADTQTDQNSMSQSIC